MVRWLVLVAALAGCDSLFGLHELARLDAPPGESAVHTVTGSITRQYVFDDQTGMPIVQATPFAAGDLNITATLRDGSFLPVTVLDPTAGTFSFVAPAGAIYAIGFAPGAPFEIESAASMLVVADTEYGRPDAAPPAAGTYLEFDNLMTLPPELALSTMGIWGQLSVPATVPSTTVAWPGAQLDGARGDRAYLVALASQGSYKTVTARAITAPTTVAGMTTKVDASSFAPVSLTACKHMTLDASVTMRDKHAGFPAGTAYWQLFATPKPELGITAALGIATGTVDVDAHYNNVFAGTRTIAAAIATTQRPIASPNPSGANLTVTVGKFVVVDDGASCTAPDLTMTVGVPGAISIQGVSLGADHASVTVGADVPRIAVTWDLGVDGPVDYYVVQLLDVPATGQPVSRRVTATVDREVVYDPALFEAGHEYYVLVEAALGRPGVASGDFTTYADTAEFGFVSSPTFTVAH